MTVKLGLIKLLTKRFDLCDELSVPSLESRPEYSTDPSAYSANINSSLACPLEPGDYSFSHTVELPMEIPRGTWACYFAYSSCSDV